MSTPSAPTLSPPPAGAPAVPVLPTGAIPCPACTAAVGPDQDWCLTCGAAARTRLAPKPNWKLPVAIITALLVIAILAIVLGFVALTADPSPDPTVTTPPAVQTTPAPTGAPPS